MAAESATATASATAGDGRASPVGVVGDLCTVLRSYCELVTLALPVLGRQHLHAAVFVPLDALEAVLTFPSSSSSSSCVAPGAAAPAAAAAAAAVSRSRLRSTAAAAAARLEEMILCAIVVTAGRVAVDDDRYDAPAKTGAGRGGGGREVADAADAAASADGAVGVELEEGMKLCAAALRDLVGLCCCSNSAAAGAAGANGNRGSRSGSIDNIGSSDGGGDEVPDKDEPAGATGDGDAGGGGGGGGGGVGCCAGLYALLLLRGSRFDALSEVVGGLLGSRATPLGGPDGAGEILFCVFSCLFCAPSFWRRGIIGAARAGGRRRERICACVCLLAV